MDSTKIQLINPDGDTISFYKVTKEDKQCILEKEVVSLHSIMKIPLFELSVHKLKNDDLLLECTTNDYAFLFKTEKDLQLYNKSNSYYDTSIHFDKGTMYYHFSLTYSKCVELEAYENKTLIQGYESKQYNPITDRNCDYKTYLLADKSVFRVFQVTENNLYGAWFPDLKSFEYFYFNDYTP